MQQSRHGLRGQPAVGAAYRDGTVRAWQSPGQAGPSVLPAQPYGPGPYVTTGGAWTAPVRYGASAAARLVTNVGSVASAAASAGAVMPNSFR